MKKALRVKDRFEFQKIIQKKQYVSSLCYTIFYQPRKLHHARVGISAPTKLGNAVVRNKIKRQLRMMVQAVYSFDEDFDSIIIVKKPFLSMSYQENLEQLNLSHKKVIMKRKREGESNESNQNKS